MHLRHVPQLQPGLRGSAGKRRLGVPSATRSERPPGRTTVNGFLQTPDMSIQMRAGS